MDFYETRRPRIQLNKGKGKIEQENVHWETGQEKVGDSSTRKLFVRGIARETTEESFRKHFRKFGNITTSIIIPDKNSRRKLAFGFVTYADSESANKALGEEHIIDGRAVEVKKRVRNRSRTENIFIRGLPQSLTEDDLKTHFSSYGNVVGHQIMLDRSTGRSRGYGFVTFNSKKAVEKVLADGCMHELGGKQVEIKRDEPRRVRVEHASEHRLHRGGIISKSHCGVNGSVEGFRGAYGGNMGRDHGGYGGYEGYSNYGGRGKFAGSYGAGPAGFNPVHGGYSDGFGAAGYGGSSYGAPVNCGGSTGGAMYGAAGYGGSSYGAPVNYGGSTGGAMYGAAGYGGSSYGAPVYYGGRTGYASSNKYGSSGGNPAGHDNANRYDNRGSTVGNPAGCDNANRYDTGGRSGGANAYWNNDAADGRFHRYWK
ncbi:heterogeneous nuclear ribonucleoprotein A0-like [Capsicum annuum]|uniref:heterogeneous nuclear ribonucleoprotein A0-like n=1 Tax=Capsicum annuum TaxID=4072 RepID=UPI001FB075DC|nr:heterogeneous nuclear ribonucleoprotein A0-like [Capsicum annuum]